MKSSMIAILLSVLVLSLAIAGCTKTETLYICANGKTVTNATICPINKVAGVKKPEAEMYAKNYVGAFFLPYGGKAQMVSSYLDPDKGDWLATFVVASKDGAPYETVVAIDGLTGKVNCTQKCEYI